ncbi:MAG: DUF1501 domain-containing protein, partial [Bacteroidota bacterium]
GCDGLQLVAPVSDSDYQDMRPWKLKVSEYGDQKGHLLDNGLNGIGFRFHSKAPELHELYQAGELAVLHACGLAHGTRSHFEAMALIERGVSQKSNLTKGWIARFLEELTPTSQIPALCSSGGVPDSFRGYGRAVSVNDLNNFAIPEMYNFPELARKWYKNDPIMAATANNTLDTIRLLSNIRPQPAPNANYPDDWYARDTARHFMTAARLIKEDLGIRMAMVDFVGWDTHENQEDYFPNQVDALSKCLAAFYRDLGSKRKNVTILVKSEFGRRLRVNRSMGTDHGYGNMMMVLGEGVKGGRMYGDWPGLKQDQLNRGVDLEITTDYRTVLGEILMGKMGVRSLDRIFPGFTFPGAKGFLRA